MYTDYFAEMLRAFATAASRRGVLAGVTGGLLAARSFTVSVDDVDAKKGKRKKKRKVKKRKSGQQPPSPPASGPVTQVDATCAGPGNTGLGGTDGNIRLAQTFTTLSSGTLVRAELSLVKEAGTIGEYILRLSPIDGAGFPTNDVLAETSVSNLNVSNGPSTVGFAFANPTSVVAGTEFALILTRPGSTHLQWEGLFGDTCAGGAFVSTDQTAVFVQPSRGIDLIFTIFVHS